MQTKIWAGVGAFAFVSASAAADQNTGFMPDILAFGLSSAVQAQHRAEGGEGGAGSGAMPASHDMFDTNPDDRPCDAAAVRAAVDAFLDNPSAGSLSDGRVAWVNARISYLQTQLSHFCDHPVEEIQARARLISGGFLGEVALASTTHQVLEEADVASRWNAVEFLLWGHELYDTTTGERLWSDYIAGDPANNSRRAHLRLMTHQLVEDLTADNKAEAVISDLARPSENVLAAPQVDAAARAFDERANAITDAGGARGVIVQLPT